MYETKHRRLPIFLARELTHVDDTFVIVLNLGAQPQTVSLDVFESLPQTLVVAAAGSHSTYQIG